MLLSPVAWSSSSTLAAGTAPPLGSVTVPVTVDVDAVCARSEVQTKNKANRDVNQTSNTNRRRDIDTPPSVFANQTCEEGNTWADHTPLVARKLSKRNFLSKRFFWTSSVFEINEENRGQAPKNKFISGIDSPGLKLW
jgi:hypothetical protein